MSHSFSERQNIIKPTMLNQDEMPIELRNRLWNLVGDYIDSHSMREVVIEYVWEVPHILDT